MTNSAPYEVIGGGAVSVYVAVDTAIPTYPALDEAPAALDWALIGLNGAKNYGEDGLTIRHPQTITPYRSLGATGTSKNFRENEDLEFEFMLFDMTAESYARALGKDPADIVDTAAGVGSPGDRELELLRGFVIPTRSLLVRFDMSPYGEDFVMQWEIPMAQSIGVPEPVYTKGTPMGHQMIFRTLEHPSLGFGVCRMQDAVPTA